MSAARPVLLQLAGVRKSYGDNVVLHDLSLSVEEHQCVALIGASGSGKSTLLRCVNLLEVVDDGVITLEGRDITDPLVSDLHPDEVRARIGMVFQSFNLFPHFERAGQHHPRTAPGPRRRQDTRPNARRWAC